MNYLNSGNIDIKSFGEERHHVVSCAAQSRDGGDADFQLGALGVADGIDLGIGLSQNVDDQRVAVPSKKMLTGLGYVLHIAKLKILKRGSPHLFLESP